MDDTAPDTTTAAPEPAPAAAPAAAPATVDIFGGMDEQTRAYVENKGWISDDPAEAYGRTLEAYQNLEKMVGGRIKIPDTEDADGWNDLYTRLGRPESPDQYEVDLAEDADVEFNNWYRETAHKHGLNQRQMAGLMADFDEKMGGMQSSIQEQAEADNAAQVDALKREWGAGYEGKIAAGKMAAQRLGVDPEMIDAMAGSIGISATLKHFAAVGEAIGEDSFEGGESKLDGPSAGMGLTPAQAQAQLSELLADTNFRDRLLKGDAGAIRRKDALEMAIGGLT